MPPQDEPQTPRDAYKAIIDAFVKRTQTGGNMRLVRDAGIYSKAEGYAEANELVRSLTPDQRRVLENILLDQRIGAIADVLSELTWWIVCRDVALMYRGKPMPFELTQEGLHGDYVGRINGWNWLDDGPPAGA